MKEPYEIIAENLPTFITHYKVAPSSLPSRWELTRAAHLIILELEIAGYRIIKDPASS